MIGTNKQKEKKRKIQENRENETCGMEESEGKFPPLLINSMNENQKREKEKKKRKKKERRGEGKRRRKRKKGKGKGKFSRRSEGRSLTVRKLKLVHATRVMRGVPKSGSFVELQEIGNFPTRIISSLKVI